MNIINKILSFIKNIFSKKEEIKELQEPEIPNEPEVKTSFIESFKVPTTEKIIKKKVETITCDGDGLGIQKKLTY